MPQAAGRLFLVSLAAGEADQLALHAPRGQEIDPGLTGIRAGRADRGLAHNLHGVRSQMRQRGIEIVDVEGEMMTAHIAIARLLPVLVLLFSAIRIPNFPVICAGKDRGLYSYLFWDK